MNSLQHIHFLWTKDNNIYTITTATPSLTHSGQTIAIIPSYRATTTLSVAVKIRAQAELPYLKLLAFVRSLDPKATSVKLSVIGIHL
jgi:hypothetical protein